MKIVFTADTHLGLDHPLQPRSGRRHRGPDFLANLDRVLAYAVETRADLVLHGGDAFDVPHVAEALVDQFYNRLVKVAEQGIPVAVVGGNHERATLPPSLLGVHPLLHVFQAPGVRRFCTPGGNVAVTGIPFIRGDVRTAVGDVVRGLPSGRADVALLLLHQAVEGATVGPQNYVFRNKPDVVPLAGLPPGFDAVLSGHIHRAQVLWTVDGARRVPVIYPGSVERTSFAEADEPKSFAELVVDGAGRRTLTRHPLPARPMVSVRATGSTRAAVINGLSSQLVGVASDAIVRIGGEPAALEWLGRGVLDEVFPPGLSLHWSSAPATAAPPAPPRTADTATSRMDRRRLALFAG